MRLCCPLISWLIPGLLLVSCSTPQPTPVIHTAHHQLIPDAKVETVVVEEEQLTEEITCQGKIVSQGRRIISASVAGLVAILKIKPGSRIKTGQQLFQLDTVFLQMNLEEARLELEAAEEKLKEKIAARPDRDSLPEDLLSRWRLGCGIPQAKQKIRRAQMEFTGASGSAPSAGRIGQVFISEGQSIAVGEKVAEYFPANSYEAELLMSFLPPDLTTGQEVEVKVHSGQQVILGTIREILPMVNEQGLFVVYVSLPPSDRQLVHGQGISASVLSRSNQTAPTVPASALTTRSGKPVLFRITDGLADWHYVTPGKRLGDKVQILEGIDVGDTVVTAGQQYLAHESQIHPTNP